MINTIKNKIKSLPNWTIVSFVIYWLCFLSESDSLIEPYILVAGAGIFGFYKNKTNSCSKLDKCFALFLSLCISLANYNTFIIFSKYNSIALVVDIINALLITIISYFLFKQILIYLTNLDINKSSNFVNKNISKHIFLYTFLAIFIFDILVMFTTHYPGVLSSDNTDQITQIITGVYSNHHPYYHTQIIKICLSVGQTLFGSMNAGVATYSVFSILIVSLSFAYVVSTIYKSTGNLKISTIIAIWYLIMPFNSLYSFTMFKDVLFGAILTDFVVSLYRIIRLLGKQSINFLVMSISSIGICLLRSNGYFIFLLSTIIFFIVYKKKYLNIKVIFICALILSYILKYPVLNNLGIRQPDTIESLAIPQQQIARVIADGNKLTKEEEALLNEIVDVGQVADTYSSWIADPVKYLVREKDNQDYLKENKLEYIKLYFELGLKHPTSYISAWIDETKGYWNSGYLYHTFYDHVEENTLGISQKIYVPILYSLYNAYIFVFSWLPGIRIFECIGVYFWMLIISTWKSLKYKNKSSLIVCIPFIMMILSLLIATPVYCEFRYAYSLFCAIPFILTTSFTNKNN